MATNRRGPMASRVVCVSVLMLLSIFASLAPMASAADWTKKDLGNIGGTITAVATGDANNDGEQEVYVVATNGGAYMFKQDQKDPANWKNINLGYGEGQSFQMMGIAVGDGRDSGSNAVYAGGYDQNSWEGKMYEFYQEKGEWKRVQMGTGGWVIYDVVMCDGDNDDREEVYASSWNGNVYEYSYSNGWNGRDIGYSLNYPQGLTCGDANHDGMNEVYSMNGYGWGNPDWDYRNAYMYSYSSGTGTWSTTELGVPPDLGYGWSFPSDIVIGDGDNDGSVELFVPDYGGTYMLKYSSGSWSWSTIFTNGYQSQLRAAVGDGDGDGKNEVYVTSDTDQVYKIAYSGGSWSSGSIGSANGDTYGVVVGDGDNYPGQVEVYAGAADSHIYQFMMDRTPPPNPIVFSPTHKPGVWSNLTDVKVGWRIPPDPSGIAGFSWVWDTTSDTNPDEKTEAKGGIDHTNSGPLADGDSYYFHIKAEDGALNWNKTAYHFGPLMIDTVAPTDTSIKVNDDQAYTNNKIASLTVAGNDARSGMGSMAFSNDGTIWPPLPGWEAWTSPRPNWDLTDINKGGNDNDGQKTVYMKSNDKAGNMAPSAVSDTIFLDRKLPVNLNIKINDGADYTNSALVALGITATDPDPASGLDMMRFSNDGTTWSDWESWGATRNGWSLTAGAGGSDTDGKKTVYYEVKDKAGNIGGPISDDIYMDRSAPSGLTITINGGASYTNVTDVRLDVTAQDAVPGSGLDKMQFSNDANTYSSWEDYTSIKNPWSLTIGAGGKDQDGQKPVYLQVKDKVSNIGGPVKNIIFLDRAKPIELKLKINDGATLTNNVKVQLNMSAKDPDPGSGIDQMKIQEVGGAWSDWIPWSTPYSFVVSSGDGSKTVCFMVKDKANNQAGPECDSIVLDTTPPTISNIKVISITDTSAIVTWFTDSPADGTVDYGTTASYGSQKKELVMATEHGITLTGLTPTTTYHFRVASTDEVGNGPTVSGDNTFTTTATPDKTPPIITNLRVEGITDVYALVLWETNEPADSYVHFGVTPDCPLIAGSDQDVRDHRISLTGLAPDTTYYINVQSTDPSGNGPVSSSAQFRTGTTPDTTAPTISNVQVSQLTDKLAVITWTTDEIASGVVEFGTIPTYGKVVTDAGFVKDHIMTLSGLSPATTYYFIVRSTDPSGNGPTTSAQYTFQTAITPDTTPPAISNVKASGITNTMAIISWNTDELSDGSVQYGITSALGQKADDITFGMIHSLTLVGLKPSTTYHFKVYSKDMSGNLASSTEITFTTTAVEDKEPPIITDVNVQGISSDVAVVVWKTNEVADSFIDFGVTTSYGMTARDERFLADHSLVIKGLNASTKYHFHVKSTDVSGNGPTVSSDFEFTTTSIKDTTAPNITSVVISDITTNSAKVSWLTNEPANTLLMFAENGTQMIQAGDNDHFVLNHTWGPSGLKPNTLYWVKAVSFDPSGNKGETATVYKFTTAKTTPGPDPDPDPNPFNNKTDWTWLYILILICVIAGILGAVYYFKTRKPVQPVYGTARGRYAAQEEEAYQVEEMQMDGDEDVQTLDMGADDEDVPTMDMDGTEEVQTLDMGEEEGLGASVSAVTSLSPPARPKKAVRTVKCPGCKSAIPVYSETQTDIKCPSCGKEGRIKPMKAAPPPVQQSTEDLSPLGSVLGSEPDIPVSRPPPRAPVRPRAPAKAPARPSTPPTKVPLKSLTCSGCRGKVPIYTDKRPIKITCPSCGKSGTLKN